MIIDVVPSGMPKIPITFPKDMLALYPISRLYDKVERTIKHEINQMFYENHSRYPTKEEYEEYFKQTVSNIKCNVTDFDLGILYVD